MKSKYSLMFAGLLLLAALALIHSYDKARFAADGAPAPPWPKLNDSLVVDGAPAPPWPKNDMADGAPAPPWPKGTETAILDNA